jgi:uncharacterized protein (DUF885 family)
MIKISKLLAVGVLVMIVSEACGKGASTSPNFAPTSTTDINQTLATETRVVSLSLTESVPDPEGLDFDNFLEASFRSLLMRDPETVLELGLSQVYKTPTDQLTNISDEYVRETQALEVNILNQLRKYDRSGLSAEQQLSYDIYTWYLGDRVNGQAFMYDDYPVNPTVFSEHLSLLQWFTDLRPLNNLQEAHDYVACLRQVDTKFNQLIDNLERREENGAMLPGFLVNWILSDLGNIANSSASRTPYYTAFESKVNSLDEIAEADRQSLLNDAEDAINTSVIPAYQALVNYFEHLQGVTTNDAGVWKFPDGEAYYAYALRHYTSTNMSAEQIHELGLQALDRIHADMRTIFDQLGYPQEEDIPTLFARVAQDSGYASGNEIVQGYEEIISAADQNTASAFDLRPNIGVIVIGGPTGGYYNPPAVDGSRPGMFYAQDTGQVAKFGMPTLAYHEAIPGHHTQIAIAQQLDLPSFRKGSDFSAYVEGWALYAEHLAYELGFYDDDPYGNLGRLQAEAFRAARLVVDTGLHAKKWSFPQAVDFMVANTGISEYMIQGEVSRYVSVPGQATAYYIGYTKIMDLRQHAMDLLGDQFDLKEFHNVILGNGAMPLDILDQVVNIYIQTKLGGG